MKDADYICVLDTGSTDGTWEQLQSFAAGSYSGKLIIRQAIINPWRFDVARNEGMKDIPADADILFSTDLDERLVPGWYEATQAAWTDDTAQGWYLYAWSHNSDGTPARVFWYNKMHDRNWEWRSPVHENLWPTDGRDPANVKRINISNKIMLHHYPTQKEGRSNYFPLLKLRAQEEWNDLYGCSYLAHEYYYQGPSEYANGIDFIHSHLLALVKNHKDDSLLESDAHMFCGLMYAGLNQLDEAEIEFRMGIAIAPTFRENYIQLANIYNKQQRWTDAINIINEALIKTRHYYSWLEWDNTWTWYPYDLLSQAYFYSGAIDAAYHYAKLALTLSTNDERLRKNCELIQSYLKQGN